MKLYNCKVRLHGDVRDEVRKKNVTSGEIRLLQHIHGEDAVSEITPLNKEAMSLDPEREADKRTAVEERDRLAQLYGERIVAELFGARARQVDEEIDRNEVEQPQLPTARRGKPPANAAEHLLA